MRKRKIEGDGTGLLVALELGGEWPGLMSAETAARRVLMQNEGESPGAFAERVASGLDSLFGRGVKLATVAVACNERVDEAADEARRKLGGLALGFMAKNHAGRLCFTASARSGGRLRHSLSRLAQGLFDEWRTAGLEATVVLGNEPESSPHPLTKPARTARVA